MKQIFVTRWNPNILWMMLLMFTMNRAKAAVPTTSQPIENRYVVQAVLGVAPTITTISCDKMGGTTSYSTTLFTDYFIGDTELEYTLTINGTGFGTQGTASTKGTVMFLGVTSYKITSITSWTDTKILAKFKASYNSEPTTNAKIEVKTSGSASQTATKAIAKLAPAVYTRQYGECTWWAAKRRKEQGGLSIPIPSYTDAGFATTIDANYEPRQFDLWRWNATHQAFVQSVSSIESPKDATLNYTIKHTINITESNGDTKGTPNMTYETIVTIAYKCTDTKKKTYTRSIKSGSYRSNLPSSATHYFR